MAFSSIIFRERFVVQLGNGGNLVGRAESVEEVQEGHSRGQRRRLTDDGQVVSLLYGTGAQQGDARRAAGHHVRVVAEDAQRVGRNRPSGDVDTDRRELTRNLVQIGNHQQQALGRREGRGERAGLERAVHRAGGAALALHLHDFRDLAPQVGLASWLPTRPRARPWRTRA